MYKLIAVAEAEDISDFAGVIVTLAMTILNDGQALGAGVKLEHMGIEVDYGEERLKQLGARGNVIRASIKYENEVDEFELKGEEGLVN